MELVGLLERMKMGHLATQLESVCEQAAKRDLAYKEFLAEALATEWKGRHQKGVEARLALARFPWVKTVEQFDFTFQPSLDRKMVRELAGLGFVERAENVILLGAPGVGKTHLAIALGVKAAEAGHRVLFLTLETLLTRLGRARLENRLERQLQQFVYPRVLILDEMGYLPMTREEASLFFRLLTRRYEKASLIITSNKSFVDWGEIRPGPGYRHPRSAAPPRHHLEHQRRELPAQGETEGRAPRELPRSEGGDATSQSRQGGNARETQRPNTLENGTP